MHENKSLFFPQDDNNNYDVIYDNENILNNNLNDTSKKITTIIQISSDLVYFTTVIGKVNIYGYCCH